MKKSKRMQNKLDLMIAQYLKQILVVVPNTRSSYGNQMYSIKIRQDVIISYEVITLIKEWIEDEIIKENNK